MVFQNNLLAGASGVTGTAPFDTTLIGNSIWLDGSGTSGDSATDTWGSESNQDRWIWATWYQPLREIDATGDRNNIFASGTASNGFYLSHTSTASTFIVFCRDNAGNEGAINTSESYRDLTAWYHILVDFDSANAVANDRISLYVNGVRVGAYSGTAIGQNNHLNTNVSGQTARIGQDLSSTPNNHMQGYLAQTVFLDNKSIVNGDLAITDFLDTFTFGTNGSQRIPKSNTDIIALASAAGTNSFCLDYSDANNIVNDASTKGNNFSTSTIAAANQTIHTPSLSYPVFNALCPQFTDGGTWSEGNTKMVSTSESTSAITTLPPISTGKYYFQWVFTDNASSGNCNVGMSAISKWTGTQIDNAYTGETFFADHRNSAFYKGSTAVTGILGASGTYALCFDLDAGKAWVGLVDTSDGSIDWYNSSGGTTGDPANGTNPTATFTANTSMVPFTNMGKAAGTSWTVDWNFGQFGFGNSAVPTGFEQITSAKVAAPDYQGIDYFDATLYEGNGTGQKVGDFVPFTDAYTVDKSAMFEEADKRYLSFTPSAGGDQKTFTFSTWFKLTKDALGQRNTFLCVDDGSKEAVINHMGDQSNKNVKVDLYNGSSFVASLTTDQEIRDTSQWYHLVVAVDTRAAVASADKIKIYINGVLQATSGTALTTNDYETEFNSENAHNIGRQTNNGIGEPSWYLAETVMVEGSQLAATSFGQVDTSTNRWIPKDVSGLTFGDEGWYLEYEGTFNSGVAATGAGKDSSGNGNHWAEQNDSGSAWATSDQFTDTPSNNFNVFDSGLNGAGTLSEGNTQIVTATDQRTTYTTMNIPATGKWYWEVDVVNYNTGGSVYLGVVEFDELVTGNNPISGLTRQVIFDNFAGNAYIYSNSSGDNLGTTWCNTPGSNNFNADGDVLQFALDQDAGTLFIGNNNTWFRAGGARDSFANATTVGGRSFKTGVKRRFLLGRGGSSAETYAINFGQQANSFSGSSTTFNAAADGNFVYTPPTGYKAVNQDNLDDTASKITAWAWIKNRDAADNQILVDRVRGVGKVLSSNNASAEATNTNTVQRFFQRGVQVGNDAEVNTANESYVLWQWLLGDSATTGSSITTGSPSLTTTGIVADADHFSIISYTGSGSNATVAHGLSAAPEMYWVRDRTDGNDWNVYHKDANASPASGSLRLDSNAAFNPDSTLWNGVPTASLINLGSSAETNELNKDFITYCFRSIPGVCKVGSYVGNGDDNGSYISLGFRPRWILLKSTTTARDWPIFDTVRDPINLADQRLDSSTNAAEFAAALDVDFLADGWKFRSDDIDGNASGVTYIYLAMADIGGNGTLPPIYGR